MIRVSRIVKTHKTLLLFSFSHVFYWISSPDLAFLYYSSGRNDTVRCNNGPPLDDGSLQYHRILSDVDFLLDCTGIQGAVISNHGVSLEDKLSP